VKTMKIGPVDNGRRNGIVRTKRAATIVAADVGAGAVADVVAVVKVAVVKDVVVKDAAVVVAVKAGAMCVAKIGQAINDVLPSVMPAKNCRGASKSKATTF